MGDTEHPAEHSVTLDEILGSNGSLAAAEIVFRWPSVLTNGRGRLSNRGPTGEELRGCADILAAFLASFKFQTVVALGALAAGQLDRVGYAPRACVILPAAVRASFERRSRRRSNSDRLLRDFSGSARRPPSWTRGYIDRSAVEGLRGFHQRL